MKNKVLIAALLLCTSLVKAQTKKIYTWKVPNGKTWSATERPWGTQANFILVDSVVLYSKIDTCKLCSHNDCKVVNVNGNHDCTRNLFVLDSAGYPTMLTIKTKRRKNR